MALGYGDHVVLVKKSPDGFYQQVNAIVLAAHSHAPTSADRKVIKVNGQPLPDEVHLDVAFARPMPDGHALKSHDLGLVFQPAYDVRRMANGLWIGYAAPDNVKGLPSAADLDHEAEEQSIAEATEGAK
jgi:hypothetical protein